MREAVVMLIEKDGLVLGVSRRYDCTKFGLIGGKKDDNETLKEAAIRETFEECNITVHDCEYFYDRISLKDNPSGEDFICYCYYASSWSGEPKSLEEGLVKWLTTKELSSGDSAAFADYNRKTFDVFKQKYPKVKLKGE